MELVELFNGVIVKSKKNKDLFNLELLDLDFDLVL